MDDNSIIKSEGNIVKFDNTAIFVDYSNFKLQIPLEMIWQPQEDITTFELAMCIPWINRNCGVMPFEVDTTLSYFRHFKIINHNK